MRKILGIPQDKFNHLSVGFGIGLALCMALFKLQKFEFVNELTTFVICLISLSVVFIIGWLWEEYQREFNRGTYDQYDALFTALGGFIGVLYWVLMK